MIREGRLIKNAKEFERRALTENAFHAGEEAGRRSVAEKLAAMFGFCITHNEADRFIRALDKALKEWDEEEELP